MPRPFSPSLALALLAPVSPAQTTTPVTVTGVVQALPGPTICLQGETHRLECTSVFLKSNLINLNALVGQNVRLTGADVGVTCHVIQVVSASPANPRLEWCGSPNPGCPVKFKVCPGGLGIAALFLANQPAYIPINPVTGTVLISVVPPPILVAQGFVGGGCLEVTVPIPFDITLVGDQFWLQGLRMDIGPVGPLQLTNSVCLTVTPFLPPCAPINC